MEDFRIVFLANIFNKKEEKKKTLLVHKSWF